MKITERRIVVQEWEETETTRSGFASRGWIFDNGHGMPDDWKVVLHIKYDKFGLPCLAVAEREYETDPQPG